MVPAPTLVRRRCAGRAVAAIAVAALVLAAAETGAAAPEDGAVPPPVSEAGPPTAVPAPSAPPSVAPEPIEPLGVAPLSGVAPGANDSNPVWSPDGSRIAFERSRGEGREIVIVRPDGTVEARIGERAEGRGDSPFLLPGESGEVSYNAGIAWAPSGTRFAFMSNGGEGNYDLYVREVRGDAAVRLTDHREKEGQADWSPAADNLVVFVSGRTGNGDLYLMDLATRAAHRLTPGGTAYLYPKWSPDGGRIAVTHGSNEDHDIYVLGGIGPGDAGTMRALTSWAQDDIRPMWSPDGTKIAFYSNYNPAGDPKVWSIIVVASDGSDPLEGDGLVARVVAADVVPDVETGPAWMPDGAGIAYVKNDRHEYNPIYIADFKAGSDRIVKTGTKMNHDVSCSPDGLLAFRAQVDQWDHVFVARLRKKAPYQ